MSMLLLAVMHIAAVAYAAIGGVFLAFSDFLMRSLSRSPGASGIETMQSINREVFRWVFMSLFLGMAPVSLLLGLVAAPRVEANAALPILLAAGAYLVGCFGVTVAFNVPMNQALAAMTPPDDRALAYWADRYLPRWTFWNTVRTVACVFASTMMMLGLIRMAVG
ncbi:hypothetical protein roselon_02194 [Roseibacterium elongatum DSM 19469]|uniref:Integral membrane protein n=1 Tax=Roseicyclus elongatus DSM 19469 TaxID=1294273 RepID=W8RTJ0_9RHOB|nr:anthrone oxygenase family protein [Roseibacterium elongatum]AHM04534.1 hypothetical protein roselon_02194 [Roseibacterium elongatum DSM 19469]